MPTKPHRIAIVSLCICGTLLACRPDTDDEGAGPGTPASAAAGYFTEVTAEMGLDFVHQSGGEGRLYLPEIMGAGAALADLDSDGDLDVYLINGGRDLGEGTSGITNRLYLQGPDGRLEDATASSGLGDPGYGMGVAVGDIDNDGHADVYVANLGPDRLYRHRGGDSVPSGGSKGGRDSGVTFEDVTASAGIDVGGWSSSAAFFDYDRDGFLDLYVVRYVAYDRAVKCFDFAGRHEYCGPTAFEGADDVLLRNRGDGTFVDVSREAGMAAVHEAGMGLVTADFDGDGWIDVYVANDADPNQLWINQGDGTFRDDALMLGAGVNAMGAAEAGMGVLAADFDNDLDLDLFMTHLVDESNTYYRNLGRDLGFEDATAGSGLDTSSVPMTGFGTAAFDADLDGRLDLVVVNGRVRRGQLFETELPPPWNDYAEPNFFYRGNGEGRFELATAAAGDLAGPVEISRGLALGDLDADGDLDVLVSNTEGKARLYRNDAPRQGHWLIVEAWDEDLERVALGAVVTVHSGERTWMRPVGAGFSYQSSSDPAAHFGLGEASRVDRLIVDWPDGSREEFPATPADQRLRLVRGKGKAS